MTDDEKAAKEASVSPRKVPPERRRVVVRFADGIPLPYEAGAESKLPEDYRPYWEELAAQFEGITLTPAFSLKADVLDDLMKRAASPSAKRAKDRVIKSDGYKTDLRRWFFADGSPAVDFKKLAHRLEGWKGVVVRAYVAGKVRPASPCANYQDEQGYLGLAPYGINSDYARTQLAGSGESQRMIDVEGNWMLGYDGVNWSLTHEDLQGLPLDPPAPQGALEDDDERIRHGTKVLGIVCARDNGCGVLGIASHVTSVGLVSYLWPDAVGGPNVAAAILHAASCLRFGDTLLIEAEVLDLATGLYGPPEAEEATYEAVRLATALGIIVVEAAGNGDGSNAVALDGLSAFAAGGRDSLAILVSAASTEGSGDSCQHKRLAYASYGDRVDCYAWGQVIRTCTFPESGGPLYGYFGQTSGATAIVAGAALVVQSHFEARYGMRLGPSEMRYLLRTHGTDPTPRGDPTDPPRIGRMPDLHEIFDVLPEALPGLPIVYMRDFIGDDGGDNGLVTTLWRSPDIIVKSSALAASETPDSAFGESSGHADDPDLSTSVVTGQTNYVYVRASNLGSVDAADVRVRVFWSPTTTLMTPSMWVGNEIGTALLPNVLAGGALTVSAPLNWEVDIPSGHYCLVAMLAVGTDPSDPPNDFGSMENFVQFVGRNRDVAWRNVSVVEVPSAQERMMVLQFVSPAPPVENSPMALAFDVVLPRGSHVVLSAPEEFVAAVATRDTPVLQPPQPPAGIGYLELPVGRKTRLQPFAYPPRSGVKCSLTVVIPPDVPVRGCRITARQTWNRKTLGGMTWKFVAAPTL